jgi:Nitrite/Sulfite reductase ferredoxin-like half domain
MRIAEVAVKYKVTLVKLTGGQRIDLLGIPKDQLPAVWSGLGMPAGFAWGKSYRTCKSCVGTDFCRYGLGDSMGLAYKIEKRGRPHVHGGQRGKRYRLWRPFHAVLPRERQMARAHLRLRPRVGRAVVVDDCEGIGAALDAAMVAATDLKPEPSVAFVTGGAVLGYGDSRWRSAESADQGGACRASANVEMSANPRGFTAVPRASAGPAVLAGRVRSRTVVVYSAPGGASEPSPRGFFQNRFGTDFRNRSTSSCERKRSITRRNPDLEKNEYVCKNNMVQKNSCIE